MQTIVVIGATSGVGLATVQAFRAGGARVLGGSRTPPSAPDADWARVDLADEASVADFAAQAEARLGTVDVLVVSAGRYTAGAVEETSIAEAHAQLDSYFYGPVRAVRAFLPLFRRQGRGRIVLMSSSAVDAGIPFHGVYTASKWALAGLAECLAHEVGPLGIHVTSVLTTGLRTPAGGRMHQAEGRIAAYAARRDRAIAVFRDGQQTGGDPAAVARAIVRLARRRRPPLTLRVGAFPRLMPYLKALMPGAGFQRVVAKAFS